MKNFYHFYHRRREAEIWTCAGRRIMVARYLSTARNAIPLKKAFRRHCRLHPPQVAQRNLPRKSLVFTLFTDFCVFKALKLLRGFHFACGSLFFWYIFLRAWRADQQFANKWWEAIIDFGRFSTLIPQNSVKNRYLMKYHWVLCLLSRHTDRFRQRFLQRNRVAGGFENPRYHYIPTGASNFSYRSP